MPTLTLTPNPIAPSGNMRVSGSGFDPTKKIQLALDGTGYTTNYFRPRADGTFEVGMGVGSTQKTQTVSARLATKGPVVATATIVVKTVVIPPVDPPPVPVPGDPTWAAAMRTRWGDIARQAPTLAPSDALTSAKIQSWIDSQPSGTGDTGMRVLDLSSLAGTLVLNAAGIDLRGHSYTILRLPPAGLIRQTATVGSSERQSFLFGEGSDMVWVEGQGCRVDSENPLLASPANIDIGRSSAHFRANGRFQRISNVRFLRQWGFGPWSSTDGGTISPTDVWVHDCEVEGAQMGLAVVGGKRVLMERNNVHDSIRIGCDIEPDSANDAIEDVLIQGNDFLRWGNDPAFSSWFFSSCPSGGAEAITMHRVTVRGNTSTGPTNTKNGNYAGIGGLAIRADDPNPKIDFVITGNKTTTPHARTDAVMRFVNVNNLTITGNTQPLSSGTLVRDTGGSGIHTITPNP
jgi:hypothetical protein